MSVPTCAASEVTVVRTPAASEVTMVKTLAACEAMLLPILAASEVKVWRAPTAEVKVSKPPATAETIFILILIRWKDVDEKFGQIYIIGSITRMVRNWRRRVVTSGCDLAQGLMSKMSKCIYSAWQDIGLIHMVRRNRHLKWSVYEM